MVKNKKKNKTKLFLLGIICFNLLYLIGSFEAFSAELSTKAVLKRDGQNLVLSANNKNYKLSCKTPGCVVYKCAQYGCRNGWIDTPSFANKGCRNLDNYTVDCTIELVIDSGCSGSGRPNHTDNLNSGNNCYVYDYRRKSYNASKARCEWQDSPYEMFAEKYCVRSECMTNGCTEWEINGKDFLSLFPSVGMATIDPNNIEF